MTAGWSEHPDARAELLHEVEYLGSTHHGLGELLLDKVEVALASICAMPNAWPLFSGSSADPIVRTRAVKPFRIRIIYYVREAEVRVVAYAHEARQPGYWRDRLN